MTLGSRQGLNIAFVGMNYKAQTACAEYLYHTYWFKRLDMDDGLKDFLRHSLGPHKKIPIVRSRVFYDSIYKVDPEIFISHIKYRIERSDNDIVISDIRYLNELRALQEMDFKIVRVTVDLLPKIGVYVKSAAAGTVALASMYDKTFAFKNNVEYSIHYTKRADLSNIMDPLLERMGYNIMKT